MQIENGFSMQVNVLTTFRLCGSTASASFFVIRNKPKGVLMNPRRASLTRHLPSRGGKWATTPPVPPIDSRGATSEGFRCPMPKSPRRSPSRRGHKVSIGQGIPVCSTPCWHWTIPPPHQHLVNGKEHDHDNGPGKPRPQLQPARHWFLCLEAEAEDRRAVRCFDGDCHNVSDALPKPYHQPSGPATWRGMGWRSIGSRVSRTPRRASNQLPTAHSQRFMTAFLLGVEPVTQGANES
jgi:hypothetical protein